MKILNRLTIKHLLMNKKRTIVTIIGIMLSTALMVGIGLLTSTFLQTLLDEQIKNNGSYHAIFEEITKDEVEQISNHIDVDKSYSYGAVGYALVPSANDYKPYIFIASADEEYFAYENLLEGRFPLNENEIVIPEHIISNGDVDYQIGEEITLEIGPRVSDGEYIYNNGLSLIEVYNKDDSYINEKLEPKITRTYKIVGIMKRSIYEDYSAPGYMAFTTKSKDIVNYRTFVEYKKVSKTYEITEKICSSLETVTNCSEHDNLLYYYGVSAYGNVNQTIRSMLAITLFLLSIGAIIVIYNSFAISTMERKKTFGLYASLGATPRQIKYTVFFEALVVGTIGILLGILSAFLGIYVVVLIMNLLLGQGEIYFTFTVNSYCIIIPVLFMVFVVFASAYLPARRSSKISAIQMIRENDEIKMPRKKVKTPNWIRKLFGIEGEIALKNIKRNKRKYRITLLAIFISIVLFISFSTYITYGLQITDLTEMGNYDIIATSNNVQKLEEIRKEEGVKESYLAELTYMNVLDVPKEYYNTTLYDNVYSIGSDNFLQISALIIPDDEYDKLASNLNVSNTKAIFLNEVTINRYENGLRVSYHTKVVEKKLDTLTLSSYMDDKSSQINVSLVNGNDYLKKYYYEISSPVLFLSEKMFDSLALTYDEDSFGNILTIKSDDYETLYENLNKKYNSLSNVSITSPMMSYKQEKNSLLVIKILLYGFIVLVTLTGVTSVFNTIYTSIHLRRKEFAILRSVGLTNKGLSKMMFFESLFFGIKSLLYALPVSFIFILLIASSIGISFKFGTLLIPWKAILISIVGVFLIVLIITFYSIQKIKKENILTFLQNENI